MESLRCWLPASHLFVHDLQNNEDCPALEENARRTSDRRFQQGPEPAKAKTVMAHEAHEAGQMFQQSSSLPGDVGLLVQ